jgi:hypothetical protein
MAGIVPWWCPIADCSIRCVKLRVLHIMWNNSIVFHFSPQLSPSREVLHQKLKLFIIREIPRILRNPKVHYRAHNSPPPFPVQSQLNLFHAPHPPQTNSWRYNLILPSHLRLRLPSGFFSSVFPTKRIYAPLLAPMHATCPAPLIRLDFNTQITVDDMYP